MFSKRLKFQLLLVQSALIAGGTLLAVVISSFLPHPRPDWLFGAVVVPLGAALSVASYFVLSRLLGNITSAISEIERAMRSAGATMDLPQFSASVRRTLPEVTSTLDRSVERLRSAYEGMAGVARRDAVTGLANRHHFSETVSTYLARSEEPAALLFIDLDRFKSVNDSLGHRVGDELLRSFARRIETHLQAVCDPHDALFARIAGDEFTVFLPAIADPDIPGEVAQAIIRALEAPFDIGQDQRIKIGASIGIALTGSDCAELELLLQHADTAMYRAKEAGRNTYRLYEERMREAAKSRLELENCLRGAARRGEFELYLQPIIDTKSRLPVSAEALLRWHHPERGTILPGAFIEVAEDSGLIQEIGAWVIGEAARISRRFVDAGQPVRIAINVSVRQLEAPNFVELVESLLNEAGAEARQLELEITESLVMRGPGQIVERLAHLRGLGFSISVDDFGMGYSNLSRLKSLPIDRVKIDQSLVRDISQSASSRTVLQAIVGLVHGLGYESVTEGVETPIQLDIVSVIGCTAIQGFGVAPPMSVSNFLEWTSERRAA